MHRRPPAQNSYPIIHLSGNAHAILGNVYRACEHSDGEPSSPIETPQPQLKSSLYQITEEENRSGDKFGKVAVALLEDYRNTKTAVQRLRSFHKKIQRCASHVSIRQGVFEQSLKNFVVLFTRSSENAHEMLANADHPTWTHTEFLEYLQDSCGAAMEALWETLSLVIADVESLDSFAQRCTYLCTSNETWFVVKPPDQTRLSFETNLQQLFRESKIEARLESLKESTASFEKLVQQRLPLRSEPQSRNPSAQTKLKLGRYNRTQEAARSLYRSFGMACIQHPIHQAQLRLRTESGNPSQVQFAMMLQYAGIMPNSGSMCCLGLTIESQVMGAVVDPGAIETSQKQNPNDITGKRKLHKFGQNEGIQSTAIDYSLENHAQSEPRSKTVGMGTDQKRLKARVERRQVVRFAVAQDITSLPLKVLDEDWPNFCDQSNFCTHVRHILTRGFTAGHPIGYLHTREDAKHMIYLSSQTCSVSMKSSSLPMKSLNNLCTSSELSTATIVSLSKQLAIAVLQYNATPWLEQWDGDHVLISHCEKTLTKLDSCLFDSYLDVSIGHLQASTGDRELHETFVPNMTLFRLGIMLLELAYQRPLREMRELSDHRLNEYDMAFATARRLRWRVSEKMGPRFADIVGKCIQCDFGQGQDLKSRLLQECFYENVVQGLEDLEMRFKHLNMRDPEDVASA